VIARGGLNGDTGHAGSAAAELEVAPPAASREAGAQTEQGALDAGAALPARPAPVQGEPGEVGQRVSAQTLAAAALDAATVGGWATHYGESYRGQPLGCGAGVYDPADPTIAAAAAPPGEGRVYPCGALLRVCGLGGCADVVVVDSCPGCWWDRETGASTLDLSEAASAIVCGTEGGGTCRVTITRLSPQRDDDLGGER